MKNLSVLLIVVLTVACADGCVPAIPFITGEPLREDRAAAIAPGMTTKQQLFERFGPPAAIMGRDEITVIPSPAVWSSFLENRFSYRFNSDTFFELFPGVPDEYRRIYYYQQIKSGKRAYILLLGIYETGETETDRLWVLMNEKTGIVEDYAYKEHGKRLINGRNK